MEFLIFLTLLIYFGLGLFGFGLVIVGMAQDFRQEIEDNFGSIIIGAILCAIFWPFIVGMFVGYRFLIRNK